MDGGQMWAMDLVVKHRKAAEAEMFRLQSQLDILEESRGALLEEAATLWKTQRDTEALSLRGVILTILDPRIDDLKRSIAETLALLSQD